MAVLVEGICVVLKCASIQQAHAGGARQWSSEVPNRSLCSDGEVASIRFMNPDDVRQYVELLETRGLKRLDSNNRAADMVVTDQMRGFLAPCDWAEFGTTHWTNDERCPISVCRLTNSAVSKVFVPAGWKFEESLSASYRFFEGGQLPDSVKFVRSEPGLDVYRDETTGQELFVGRTAAQP